MAIPDEPQSGVKMSEMLKVVDGQVIVMEYTLKVDGEIIDTSEGIGPIEFVQGAGNIIPGLERKLYGMTIGESKDVVVTAEDGYGDVNSEAYIEVPRYQFPANIPMEIGTQLELHDQAGNPMHARIDWVGDETVRLDFNHPLAGKELSFAVKIAGLRDATDEEREHGHVHGEGHEH
jgi:FKBP-type peptidyl-prolyl cis-trans isomerase SlyD